MNCPRCGAPVISYRGVCGKCGADLTAFEQLNRLSNSYYNLGLKMAMVRDLSGAIRALKKSLELNKRNIDARNLLGLIYYEMGEMVPAIYEWVISKNLMSEDNEADYFLERMQDNPGELDNFNLAIKKYNLALEAARQGNDDTAVIQLKKALGVNPKYLQALQLLGLLYIKRGDYSKADKVLERAQLIDVANTKTLRYRAELKRLTDNGEAVPSDSDTNGEFSATASEGTRLSHFSSYKEDKPNVMAFINLLIGVIIGVVVVYYLIVPTVKSRVREEFSSQQVDYSSELSAKDTTIAQQTKKISSLESQVEGLSQRLEAALVVEPIVVEVDNAANYSAFFDVWSEYNSLISRDYSDDELRSFVLNLWRLNSDGIENAYALGLITSMRDTVYPLASKKLYREGKDLFDAGDYEKAAEILRAVVDINPGSDSAMYYLGKALQSLDRLEEAAEYYRLMLEVCPNSTLKEYIPLRLKECGYTE